MRIMTPDALVKIGNGEMTFKPYCRYIVSDYESDELIVACPNTNWRHSSFNSFRRPYDGSDLNGKKIVIYRHNAYGDQLIASAVPSAIMRRYPSAVVHLYCHPQVTDLWFRNPLVGGFAISLPIPFEVTQAYDFQVFYEGMLEANREPDQNCCYDDMFGVAGIKVEDYEKKPCVFPRPDDYRILKEIELKEPYILYHMSPHNKNRCYPPKQAKTLLQMLLTQTPYHVYVIGTDPSHEYDWVFGEIESEDPLWGVHSEPRLHNLLQATKSFRDLIPILEKAKLLICPDSSPMHLAAVFDHLPVISLWGLFHPNDRIKYYPNSHPICSFESCPSAPCRDHDFELPVKQCRHADGAPEKETDIHHCLALAAITPETIMEKVVEVLDL